MNARVLSSDQVVRRTLVVVEGMSSRVERIESASIATQARVGAGILVALITLLCFELQKAFDTLPNVSSK